VTAICWDGSRSLSRGGTDDAHGYPEKEEADEAPGAVLDRRGTSSAACKMGYKLGNRTREWPPRLKALFHLGDPAVHHELTHRGTVPHPSGLPFNVSKEFGDYSLAALRDSLDLACDVECSR
jgi:hypothetical protein